MEFAEVREHVLEKVNQLHANRNRQGLYFGDQRMMLLSAGAFGSLREEMIETLGKDIARGLIKRFGFQAGFSDGHMLRTQYPELTLEQQMHLGTIFHEQEGMAHIETMPEHTEVDLEKGVLNIHSRWFHSLEAEQIFQEKGPAESPQCWSLTGYASGHLSYLLQKPVIAVELSCRAQGHEHCEFNVRFRNEMERLYPGSGEDFRSVNLNEMFQSLKNNLSATTRKIRMLEERLKVNDDNDVFAKIIGESPPIKRILNMIKTVASYNTNVLVTGESGTGKELIARSLHESSLRADKPFVAINCATLSESLQHSELFGHVRGAFTGAHKDRAGMFEKAHGGTLFLDEVGEMAPGVQASFLRVLQEGVVMRVGEHRERKVDVRIIAATHRNLGQLVAENKFREDIFYRLNVVHLDLPPLRDRGNDVLLLAQEAVERMASRFQKQIDGFDCDVARLFMRYPWPGNVRELNNIIERGVLFARGAKITLADLPECFHQNADTPQPVAMGASHPVPQEPLRINLEADEQQRVLQVLREVNHNRGLAAERLGMSRSTLWRKLKKWGTL